jgi:hypothetical protein
LPSDASDRYGHLCDTARLRLRDHLDGTYAERSPPLTTSRTGLLSLPGRAPGTTVVAQGKVSAKLPCLLGHIF